MLHKAIEGFEDYLVTDTGQVYSLKTQKYLKARKTKKGYMQVDLRKNGKRYHKYVHRLVAGAFIPNPNDFEDVDHIDFDITNNNVKNLRWLDKFENLKSQQNNIPIIEIIDGKASIMYLSLRKVSGVDQSALMRHIQKGETEFYVKQYNGNVRHFKVWKGEIKHG